MTDVSEEFMTVAQVAGILKLNQQTVRNWIDQGRLPALRVGRRVRIRRDDFNRLIESSATGRPAAAGASFTGQDFWSGELHPPPLVPDR